MGYLAISENGGKSWTDLTPTLTDPPNSWNDDPAPTAADLTYVQMPADTHRRGTFYVLAEWQEAGGDWRGWLLRTDDYFTTHTWQSLGPMIGDDGYAYARSVSFLGANPSPFNIKVDTWAQSLARCADFGLPSYGWQDAGLASDMVAGTYGQFWRGCSVNSGVVFQASFGASFNRVAGIIPVEMSFIISAPAAIATECRIWADNDPGGHSFGAEFIHAGADPKETVITRTTNMTRAFDVSDYVGFSVWGLGSSTRVKLDWIRIDTAYMASAPQKRPLALDVDDVVGDNLFLTLWDGTNIVLSVYDAETLTPTASYTLGAATEAQVDARTYYAVPRAPFLPGHTGDECYIFGRWDDGSEHHLYYSGDGGQNFTDLSAAAWAGMRVGALSTAGAPTSLHAFVNDASDPALWRTQDTGSNWQNILALPFSVEWNAVTRHPNGTFAAAANDAIAGPDPRAVSIPSPYLSYSDISGTAPDDLPDSVDGSTGWNTIVWYA